MDKVDCIAREIKHNYMRYLNHEKVSNELDKEWIHWWCLDHEKLNQCKSSIECLLIGIFGSRLGVDDQEWLHAKEMELILAAPSMKYFPLPIDVA